MKYSIIFFLFFLSISADAQKSDLLDCAVKSENANGPANVEVYIFSDPRCGFCRRALKDIGGWSKGKSINIIAMDLSGEPESTSQLELYTENEVEVRDASQCDEKIKKFIPRIYIKETGSNKQVMKLRGWHTRDLDKLEKKLKKYI
ncbi:MAG: hypothetical protein AAFZ15_31500 [Bacteroidota bacterium]